MRTDAQRNYDRAARDLHETDGRITSIGHRAQGGVDSKILPSLIAKRDRLVNEVIALKIAADAERPDRFTSRAGSHITFKEREWHAAGSLSIEDIVGDIPNCLKRVRA